MLKIPPSIPRMNQTLLFPHPLIRLLTLISKLQNIVSLFQPLPKLLYQPNKHPPPPSQLFHILLCTNLLCRTKYPLNTLFITRYLSAKRLVLFQLFNLFLEVQPTVLTLVVFKLFNFLVYPSCCFVYIADKLDVAESGLEGVSFYFAEVFDSGSGCCYFFESI